MYPGALIATSVPQTFNIPYRPSADPSCRCGRWFNPLGNGGAGACQNSISTVLTFTFPPGTTIPTDVTNVIWTVQFNTSTSGYTPRFLQSCTGAAPGCPYDSLNVGVMSFPGAPYAGIDVNEGVAFRSFAGQLLTSELDWTGLQAAGGDHNQIGVERAQKDRAVAGLRITRLSPRDHRSLRGCPAMRVLTHAGTHRRNYEL